MYLNTFFNFFCKNTKNGLILHLKLILKVGYISINENKINCYPNPATGNVTINFNVKNLKSGSVRIFDLQGRNLIQTYQS